MNKATQDQGLRSMTGFAAGEGALEAWRWNIELRSVNGKGLDLRLRLPDWVDGLEQAVRGEIGKRLKRGNVNLSLRISRDDASGTYALNNDQLEAALSALREIERRAMEAGLDLAPSRAADIAQMRGVFDQRDATGEDTSALRKGILDMFGGVLRSLDEMRQAEGTALAKVLAEQLDAMERLTKEAAGLAEARKDQMAANLNELLARVMAGATGADPDRVAQELALITVKADVTEEIDRLKAHIKAARDLLNAGGSVGRKLDFLMQEFNREANTLCSKAQNSDLTRVGLELKTLIDQMREQVQNVE